MKKILFLLILAFVLACCDKPECKNTNPIFDVNSIESNVYKKELIKEINRIGKQNLTYWFSEYSEEKGEDYIIVDTKGEGLCAKVLIHVTNWENMKNIKNTNGKGYRGAQLKNLDFDIISGTEYIAFEFKGLGKIID